MMETLWQDLRFGLRMLLKNPGLSAVAILTLALGIGANTAIFSVVNAVLLRPLPYPAPDRLVQVLQTLPSQGIDDAGSSYPSLRDWRAQNSSFEEIGASHRGGFTLTGLGEPEIIEGSTVTPAVFPILRTKPLVGRTFFPDDEKTGAQSVVLMSEGLWRRRFGASPDVVGKAITLNKETFTVVGILPENFRYPYQNPPAELWIPVTQDPDFKSLLEKRGAHFLDVIARLKTGVSLEKGQAELSAIQGRLADQYPKEVKGWDIRLVPMQQHLVGNVRPALLVILGAVGLVLLIACANVANLLLARATSRAREMAVRCALGAGRGRLIRQLLTESAVLGVAGGGLGLLLAFWGVQGLTTLLPDDLPRIHAIQVDGWVLGFTLFLSLIAASVFGLAPAMHASDSDLQEGLREGGRGGSSSGRRKHLRSLLVVSEVALAVVLLAGSGLLIRSFLRLQQVNPGFNPQKVLTAAITLPQSQYSKPEQWTAFYGQLLERVHGLPGVESAAVALPLPLSASAVNLAFHIEGREGRPEERTSANYSAVSPDYFRTMAIPILRGRVFTEQDSATAPKVCAISEAMARQYFPHVDPIGKRLVFGYQVNAPREIVGIVGDVKRDGLDVASAPEMYLPYPQDPWWVMLVAIRTTGDPGLLSSALREQIHALDKDLPIGDIQPMTHYLYDSVAPQRFRTLLLGLFGAIALLLAGVGIYGVISYSVSQRTHEIGIRIALGAVSRDVLGLVVAKGLRLTLVGLALGLAGALGLTRLISSLLFGISATDPVTFAAVALGLLGIALLACYVPARRAMRVDPIVALRYE